MKKILITTSSFNLNNMPQAGLLREAGFDIVLNPYKRRLTEEEVGSLLKKDVVGMIAGVEHNPENKYAPSTIPLKV